MASTELFLLRCVLLFFPPLSPSRVSCEMKTIRHIDLKGAQLTFLSLYIFGGAGAMQLLLPFAGLARLKPGAGGDLTAGLLLGKNKIVVAVVSVSSRGQIPFVIECTVHLQPLFLPVCPLGVTQKWGEELSTDTTPQSQPLFSDIPLC